VAYVGALTGALVAFALSFVASPNLTGRAWLVFSARRLLEFCRTVPDIVFALIFVVAFGLGPLPGVLALALHTAGALGKLFAEIIESADVKQPEGVRAAGGWRMAEVRFGLLPQVLPVIAGQILYFIESNTRSATIIGVVGAGGIGLYLSEQIRVLEWKQVSFLILMILISVAAIDFISGKLRAAIAGRRVAPA
jgi:phosphonate transport system permease protein